MSSAHALPGGGFDIDRDVQSRQLSRGMRVASFLGALALSAILILLLLLLLLLLLTRPLNTLTAQHTQRPDD